MSGTTILCIATSRTDFVSCCEKPKKLNSAFSSFYIPAYSSASLSLSGSFINFASFRQTRSTASFSMATPISVKVNASATIDVPNNKSEASSTRTVGDNDLLIVGPGVLGRIVAEKWREEHPGSQIYGQTLTTDHHDDLLKIGINPSLKGTTQVTDKFSYVIFCAPPYGSTDYPGEVREATLNWNGGGSFLFTSSSAPYDCSDNGSCDEDTPVVPIGRSPRTDNLLKAEKVVLEAGGCVDAASLSVTILKKKLRGKIFLGCDNHFLSRQELMDLVNKSGKYSKKFEAFTGTSDPLGKKLNNSKTRAELGWEPKYPSFAQFLESL
ncbi:hypothetical protein PHJA_000333800 [Phtheirospermum japonicum]|uniref:NAD(P)-binding domain-containing protein n=1 Tax=Phtheirospermum japonicum TaxID=374723 RepID=A0A830BD66_9LAMI|nr:hypothetical protein PHJA_000333800 [Phtheirospermum japonicum]